MVSRWTLFPSKTCADGQFHLHYWFDDGDFVEHDVAGDSGADTYDLYPCYSGTADGRLHSSSCYGSGGGFGYTCCKVGRKMLEILVIGKAREFHWRTDPDCYSQASYCRSGRGVDDGSAGWAVSRSGFLGQAAGTGSQHRPSGFVGYREKCAQEK